MRWFIARSRVRGGGGAGCVEVSVEVDVGGSVAVTDVEGKRGEVEDGGDAYSQSPRRRKQVGHVAIADVGIGGGKEMDAGRTDAGKEYGISALPCQPSRANARAVRLMSSSSGVLDAETVASVASVELSIRKKSRGNSFTTVPTSKGSSRFVRLGKAGAIAVKEW